MNKKNCVINYYSIGQNRYKTLNEQLYIYKIKECSMSYRQSETHNHKKTTLHLSEIKPDVKYLFTLYI